MPLISRKSQIRTLVDEYTILRNTIVERPTDIMQLKAYKDRMFANTQRSISICELIIILENMSDSEYVDRLATQSELILTPFGLVITL